MTAKGYLYAELKIHDEGDFYNRYMHAVKPMLEKWGATFIVATDSLDILEGDREVARVIILEFSSLVKARDFYYSDEYQSIIGLRLKSSSAHLYIMEGHS
ncbi:DUF1330 domain-containing protein [Pseudomonas sp. NPDC089752]|uniref:DUF1330 domain-containing protein n=1 Tax=Pseudomonas sp. NPDC089752 TaxID=3364472 RepID=UPI0038305350